MSHDHHTCAHMKPMCCYSSVVVVIVVIVVSVVVVVDVVVAVFTVLLGLYSVSLLNRFSGFYSF